MRPRAGNADEKRRTDVNATDEVGEAMVKYWTHARWDLPTLKLQRPSKNETVT